MGTHLASGLTTDIYRHFQDLSDKLRNMGTHWVHTLRYTQAYGDAHGDTIVYMQAHKALSGTFGHT